MATTKTTKAKLKKGSNIMDILDGIEPPTENENLVEASNVRRFLRGYGNGGDTSYVAFSVERVTKDYPSLYADFTLHDGHATACVNTSIYDDTSDDEIERKIQALELLRDATIDYVDDVTKALDTIKMYRKLKAEE